MHRFTFWIIALTAAVSVIVVLVYFAPWILAALGLGVAGASRTARGAAIASRLAHAEKIATASDRRVQEERSRVFASRARSDAEHTAYVAEASYYADEARSLENDAQAIRRRHGW